MRILFYLPAVTRNWLDNLLAPLIRRMAHEAEVHVVVPLKWMDTGIDPVQLQQWIDLPDIRWHILDGADHPSFRTAPASPDDLIDFLGAIDADYTFCRSADITTPLRFPGKVRFLMEADYPPLLGDYRPHSDRIMMTGAGIFDHGRLPALAPEQRARLTAYAAPLWETFQKRYPAYPGGRAQYLEDADLPTDRPIIAVPLEAEGRTNFFEDLYWGPSQNEAFIYRLIEECDPDTVLALTPHPVSAIQPPDIQCRISASMRRLAELAPDRLRVLTGPGNMRELTRWLVQYSDGVILRDSKVVASAAFYGKPILRLSQFATGDWINAYDDIGTFLDDVGAGRARTAALDDALAWYAFHHANNAFVPYEARHSLQQLLDYVDQPVNPDRWEASLQRHRHDFANWFAPPPARADDPATAIRMENSHV